MKYEHPALKETSKRTGDFYNIKLFIHLLLMTLMRLVYEASFFMLIDNKKIGIKNIVCHTI